jgi:hypothetical protein
VIGLDDLLSDFYGGKSKTVDEKSRDLKASKKGYDSDEDDKRVKANETYLRKFVEDCEKQASVYLLPISLCRCYLYSIVIKSNLVSTLKDFLTKLNKSSLKIESRCEENRLMLVRGDMDCALVVVLLL